MMIKLTFCCKAAVPFAATRCMEWLVSRCDKRHARMYNVIPFRLGTFRAWPINCHEDVWMENRDLGWA
jgi:hypothetical protein